MSAALTVIKIGGSVLTDREAYARAAGWLRALALPGRPLLAVVSAESGHTDALYDEARSWATPPDEDALNLLWSTGELRSVALLTLALRAAGVTAVGLNVHETGLRRADDELAVNPIGLRSALARHAVVVVPGFLAIQWQQIVTLGRGGSDLSAVRLAAALGAGQCILLKDVDGYFTGDPAVDRAAVRIPTLTFAGALGLAEAGCPLVQGRALIEAARANLPIVVRSMGGVGTTVS